MKRTGAMNFGCIIGTLLIAAAAYAAWRVIPVKVKAAEFEKTVESLALQAAGQGAALSNERIIKLLVEKADELELPVTEKQITIKRSGGFIRVEAEYSVPVNLFGYEYNMRFAPYYENPLF